VGICDVLALQRALISYGRDVASTMRANDADAVVAGELQRNFVECRAQ
jgi:hypothetical protein